MSLSDSAFRPVDGEAKLLVRIPGNQLLQIAVQQKTLRLPRLPPQLDGLRRSRTFPICT